MRELDSRVRAGAAGIYQMGRDDRYHMLPDDVSKGVAEGGRESIYKNRRGVNNPHIQKPIFARTPKNAL